MFGFAPSFAREGKLKLRCGSQFTSKMEGMMNDLAIGGDHEAAFEKYLKEGNDGAPVDVDKIEFNVQVKEALFGERILL